MKKQRTIFWQRGTSLPMALVTLAVGVLLVSPFLGYLATSYRSTLAVEETLHREYANDAGVEYAMWKLEDSAFRQELVANWGTAQEITMPQPVNDITPTVEIVFVESVMNWNWSIWVSDTLTIEKNNTEIYGDVRYGEFSDDKGNTTFHGDRITGDEEDDWPVSWDIADFQPGGEEAEAAISDSEYYTHTAPWIVDDPADLQPGLHYCSGDMEITQNVNNESWSDVTIVTKGTIYIHGNSLTFKDPYIDGLAFFSGADSAEAMVIDGNNFTIEGGVCYAPHGTIVVTANNTGFYASLVSRDVEIRKNNTEISQSIDLFIPNPGSDDFCGVYDIRSVADDTTTTVRLTRCGQSAPSFLAWSTN